MKTILYKNRSKLKIDTGEFSMIPTKFQIVFSLPTKHPTWHYKGQFTVQCASSVEYCNRI